MYAPLAARLPVEMLHNVRNVSLASIDPGFLKRLVEQLSGGAYKRVSLKVLVVAWLLADQKDFGA
jgi:hypothetical protein